MSRNFAIQLALGFASLAALLFWTGCGGSSSTTTPPPAGEVITPGQQSTPQSQTVEQLFKFPLQVTVTNNGSPVANATVTFTAPGTGASGTFVGGSLTNTGTTDKNGVAMATSFQANSVAGAYQVTASVSGVTPAAFVLTNLAGPPAAISVSSGSGQSASVGTAFASPLKALVVDSFSNPVSGAAVTFTAPAVGPSATFAGSTGSGANTAMATTGANGVAISPAVTAGPTTGNYMVAATVAGVTAAANFSLTNITGAGTTITATSGSPQYAPPGTTFAKQLQATVVDQFSNPVIGATVTFTANTSGGAGGTFSNGTATDVETTGTTGSAISKTFTANGTLGCYTVSASTSGATTSATFNLSNVQPALSATAGTTQSATVNTEFATPLQATVTGSESSACGPVSVPLPGVTVTFAAPSSGASGKFSDTSSATTTAVSNALGVATAAAFTANGTGGSYAVAASASGFTAVNFNLTNTASVSSLTPGTYIFSLSGTDNTGSDVVFPYSLAGAFTVGSGSAAGTITGGELDFVDYYYAVNDQINSVASSITTNTDGNFVFTLVTCNGLDCNDTDTNVGVGGTLTLDASFFPQNSAKAYIIEFDSSATSSGTLDLQSATTVSAGGYAFNLSGLDTFANPIAMGGVIDINGADLLDASGSIFDANDDETIFTLQQFSSGGVSAPDSFGRVQVKLDPTDATDFPEIVLAGYLVDGTHIRLVETSDSYLGELGGSAYWQGGNTGTFSSASISGNSYVVGLTGSDTVGTLQVAGLFTLNSNGTVSGFINYNDFTGTETQAPSAITGGTYTIDGPSSGQPDAGTGRVTLTGVTDGKATFNLEFYVDGNGNVTAASMDTTDLLGGFGYQQGAGPFTSSSFNGAYAMNATGMGGGDELDTVGPVTATGTGGTFSGSYDLSWLYLTPTPADVPDEPVSGTFVSDADSVFTGTITGLDVTTCHVYSRNINYCSRDVFNYYLIDATGESIAIETDTNQVTLGYFFQK